MRSLVARLVEEVEGDPKRWVVTRETENYDQFLNLFLDLGYPQIHTSQLASWRRRTQETWELLDKFIPENCTGGMENGQVVSTIGALPVCEKILYVHSGAMQRTLRAAVTLLAATHCTFDVMSRLPEIDYWMGIYAHGSRFVTTWQRPSSFVIPEQIEIEEIRVYPSRVKCTSNANLSLVRAERDDFKAASDTHRAFAEMLLAIPENLRHLYRLEPYSVRRKQGTQLALVLIADGLDELTAFNIPRWVFVIPKEDCNIGPDSIDALRSCEPLRDRVLRVVMHQRVNTAGWDTADCQFVPAFIALTPRHQLQVFKRSLREAFCHLLEKYSDTELADLLNKGTTREVARGASISGGTV
jgi:hypothetical protein